MDIITKRIEDLKKTIANLLAKGVSPSELAPFIMDATSGMIRMYSPDAVPEFAVGDIVDATPGQLLDGEGRGGHVPFIIIGKGDGIFNAIPLNRPGRKMKDKSPMDIDVGRFVYTDKTYIEKGYNNTPCVAILRSIRILNTTRINRVVGRVTEDLMKEIREMLPKAFVFENS